MAEQRVQDVVDQTLLEGDLSSSNAPAITSNTDSTFLEEIDGGDSGVVKENGSNIISSGRLDETDDISARSDTDTSRAEGSIAEDKSTEPQPVKKFTAKPVSFAKYSVPKVIAANAVTTKSNEKVATPNSSTSSLQQIGRPRLVAKTTSSLQQKVKTFKTAAPDPMQVWNKNRVTPQPSTKHLTDEELKQQYGIHLTSRIQTDGEGKEAKWADIDDDEDDWAPETIEWNDGTKTTLTAAEVAPASTPKAEEEVELSDQNRQAQQIKVLPPQFTSTIGPNATVLKLGASAERQQAQKAAESKAKSNLDKPSLTNSKTTPAPAPAKSPWAPLPPVDKVSPIVINPQPMSLPTRMPNFSYPQGQPISASSPAKEISADDFNRSWRDSSSSQPRELFMPNSGRYEAVPENANRRRMSKNDPNFRAPAVLQRPSQSDSHAPAEPSAAFQTNRNSIDSRRRASSTISGGSGQFARRMSIKSGDLGTAIDSQPRENGIRPASSDGPPTQVLPQTPAPYQARPSASETAVSGDPVPSPYDLEAQRAQQKQLMRENIERARQRKADEEARLEAAKQERIKAKLASLGPAPEKLAPIVTSASSVAESPVSASATSASVTAEIPIVAENKPTQDTAAPGAAATVIHPSPPKPPQPLATGEPQQYGMMKVHALDTIKKPMLPPSQSSEPARVAKPEQQEPEVEQTKSAPATLNGNRQSPETQRHSNLESPAMTDRSPRVTKPASSGPDARAGWGDLRDHRAGGNLWGLPNNKALGNGTFDQSLAGYAPQDLSRTPSTAQGWMSGRTPIAGRSPQAQYVHQHQVQEQRPNIHQPLVSPDQPPLADDSEIDSLFPITKPAPIGPPQSYPAHPLNNGHQPPPQANSPLAGWNSFHQVANQNERTENERYQRDLALRREEELRTGVRPGPQYTFNETWKQVNIGDQAGQRHVANVNQSSVTPGSQPFGAVGSVANTETLNRVVNGVPGRGSRFFPQIANGHTVEDRRSFTYSHPEPPRSPSPPPAEEIASHHPAFDGDFSRPAVRLPRERAVVKLPPAINPNAIESVPVTSEPSPPLDGPATPLTWAARVSMPAPIPQPSMRSVSTPLVQNPSWQERFNGLLGKKSSPPKQVVFLAGPVLAVTSATRDSLEILPRTTAAAVSMPRSVVADVNGQTMQVEVPEEVEDDLEDSGITTKVVEDEEDLFEDRELASLPAISLPQNTSPVQLPLAETPRKLSQAADLSSSKTFMVNNVYETRPLNQQFAIIHMPLSPASTSVRKDLPFKGTPVSSGHPRNRNASGGLSSRGGRFARGAKRQASKAH